MNIKQLFTCKNFSKIILIFLALFLILIIASLPIGLKYNYKIHSYVNFIGIPKIIKIYDIKRHIDELKDPYVVIIEGYGFEDNKASVWVCASHSDYFYPLCINTAGDIVYEDFCNPKQADDYIIKHFDQP